MPTSSGGHGPEGRLFARDLSSLSPGQSHVLGTLSSRPARMVATPVSPPPTLRVQRGAGRVRERGPEVRPLHLKTDKRGFRKPGGHMSPGAGVWRVGGTARVSGACSMAQKLKVKAVAVTAWPALDLGRWLCFLGNWCVSWDQRPSEKGVHTEPVGERINIFNPPNYRAPGWAPGAAVPPPHFPVLRSPTLLPQPSGEEQRPAANTTAPHPPPHPWPPAPAAAPPPVASRAGRGEKLGLNNR